MRQIDPHNIIKNLFIDSENIIHHSNCIRAAFVLNWIYVCWNEIEDRKILRFDFRFMRFVVSFNWFAAVTRSPFPPPASTMKNEIPCVHRMKRVKCDSLSRGRFQYREHVMTPNQLCHPTFAFFLCIWIFLFFAFQFKLFICRFRRFFFLFSHCAISGFRLVFVLCCCVFLPGFLHFNLSVSVIHLVSNTNLYDDNATLGSFVLVFLVLFVFLMRKRSEHTDGEGTRENRQVTWVASLRA